MRIAYIKGRNLNCERERRKSGEFDCIWMFNRRYRRARKISASHAARSFVVRLEEIITAFLAVCHSVLMTVIIDTREREFRGMSRKHPSTISRRRMKSTEMLCYGLYRRTERHTSPKYRYHDPISAPHVVAKTTGRRLVRNFICVAARHTNR